MCLLVCALCGAWAGTVADLRAGTPPQARADAQLVFPPPGADPIDLPARQRATFELTSLRLTHAQHAEVYDLSGWVTLGDRHALAVGMPYIGVEGLERFGWGGGAPWLRWSSHTRPAGRGGLAADVLMVAPLGDRDLYPVSVRAPSVFVRGRAAIRLRAGVRAWLGLWGRRVSPPDDHDRPRSAYPSGAGVDLLLLGTIRSAELELVARLDRGGLPESTWLQATAAIPIAEELALRLGGATALGPFAARPIDSAWTLGLQWRPPAAPASPAPPPKGP